MDNGVMLSPFGWLYSKIINKRNEFYANGRLESTHLGVPTISIGNITVGGTGKTPLVAYVAEVLAEKGEKVCIISRGYKRENEKERVLVSDGEKILANAKLAGDEPFELAEKLLGKAVIIADANRVEAGLWAKEKFGITAFVLDDAFQHLKIKRDLDIVTIDATNPFGNRKPLPDGILREPLSNLKRADIFVITRANLVENIDEIKTEIFKYNKIAKIFTVKNKIEKLNNLSTNHEQRTTNNYLAFCALGNPENFFEQLRRENFEIVAVEKFKDHHFYTQTDIERVEETAKKLKADALITTAKDASKLKDLRIELPCFVAESRLIFDDEEKFRELLSQ